MDKLKHLAMVRVADSNPVFRWFNIRRIHDEIGEVPPAGSWTATTAEWSMGISTFGDSRESLGNAGRFIPLPACR